MTKYPGLREHIGINGCYRVHRHSGDLAVDVYLRSVPSFEEEHGKWVMGSACLRDFPDITFLVDDTADYWSVVSMDVPSFGMDGVNEFLAALLQHQESLNQVDELLPVLAALLDEPDTVWGRAPVDLETCLGVYPMGDEMLSRHPGI